MLEVKLGGGDSSKMGATVKVEQPQPTKSALKPTSQRLVSGGKIVVSKDEAER